MRTILLISAAALALASCQKAPNASDTAKTAGAEDQSPTAATIPHRRAGLWSQTLSSDGKPAVMGAMKICVDAASEAKAMLFGHNLGGAAQSHCGAPTVSHGLNGDLTFSSTCPLGDGATLVTKGTASGDFSSAYQVHLVSDITSAKIAALDGHHTTDIEGKWIGPCPAGMTGGDIELANGMKVGHHSLSNAAAALRGVH